MKIIPITSNFIEAVLSENHISNLHEDNETTIRAGVNALLSVFFSNYSGIIWIADKKGRVIFPETEGIKKHKIVGDSEKAQSFFKFFETQFSENKDLIFSVEKKLPFNWPSSFENVDFDNYLYPINGEGTVLGDFIGISVDVSYKEGLSRQLKESKEKAERAVKEKDSILSRMSHEIFSPLNEINGLTHAASEAKDLDSVNQYLQKINNASRKLTQIVNDMLGISKFRPAQMVLAQNKFNIWKKLESFIQLSTERINLSNIDMEIYYDESLPDELIGDDMRFAQIIVNLVSNSAKLQTKEGVIKLYVDRGRNVYNKQEVILRVVNMGGSTNRMDLDRILLAIDRSDNPADSDFKNADIGLSIIKNMVEVMGGAIKAKSDTPQSTEIIANVWLKIPGGDDEDEETSEANELINICSTTESHDGNDIPENRPEQEFKAENEKKEDAPRRRNYSQYTVLAVDDIEINIDMLSIMLESSGINIKTAENGAAAVEDFKSNPGMFDLILMDIHMPIMDGYEASRTIRKLESRSGNRIPILAMSANINQTVIESAFASGMDGYVAKPFELSKLLSEMDRYLK